MSQMLIKPTFNRFNSQLAIPCRQFNQYMRTELCDNITFYQKQFGIYSFMKLNKKQKFMIHTMQGQPFMWQPHLNCSWDDTGTLRIGQKEIQPCNGKINESWCYDELFDSCFEHFLSWGRNKKVTLDNNGVNMVNEMIRILGQNALLGAMLTLTVGQLYNVNKVEFNKQTPGNIKDLFARTMNTCKGWVELVREMALLPKYKHMNCPGIFKETDFQGKKYKGDVVKLFDNLRQCSSHDMECMLNEGAILDGSNGLGEVIFIVSTSIFNAFAEHYRKSCRPGKCDPRVTKREFTHTVKGRSKTTYVYYIDGIPVVPVSHINYADRYLTGCTHFAALTVAGNIGLGSSMAEITEGNLANQNIALCIERETSVRDYGKYYFMAHALFATAIANSDLFVGAQIYAET